MYFHMIMPLGADPNASDKRQRVKRIAEAHKLVAHFPNYSTVKPSFDLNSTIQDLKGASFVIADLSLERPSCYYELGLAEALRKRVHLIAQAGTDIHQNAARDNVLFFDDLIQFEAVIDAILLKESKK